MRLDRGDTGKHAPTPDDLLRDTFGWERWRSVFAGVIDSIPITFLLLMAVKYYRAGTTAQTLIATEGSLGLILSPFSVVLFRRLGWRIADCIALLYALGSLGFLAAALFPNLHTYGAGAIFALACGTSAVPLLTELYRQNYPRNRRGTLFSVTVMIRVASAGAFSLVAGGILSRDIGLTPALLALFALCFLGTALVARRFPSTPLPAGNGRVPIWHPFRALGTDVVFRKLIVVWILMGFGNLMMVPLRVLYLVEPRYGLHYPEWKVALLTGVIPAAVHLACCPVWGRLFDRVNFFLLRTLMNLLFMGSHLAFFTARDLHGFVVGSVLMGCAFAGGNIAWSLWVTKVSRPADVADHMSVHTFFTGVRALVAPIVAIPLSTVVPIWVVLAVSVILILLSCVPMLSELQTLGRAPGGEPLVGEMKD